MADNGGGTEGLRERVARVDTNVSWIKNAIGTLNDTVTVLAEKLVQVTVTTESNKARLDSHRTTLRVLMGGISALLASVLFWVLTHGWQK